MEQPEVANPANKMTKEENEAKQKQAKQTCCSLRYYLKILKTFNWILFVSHKILDSGFQNEIRNVDRIQIETVDEIDIIDKVDSIYKMKIFDKIDRIDKIVKLTWSTKSTRTTKSTMNGGVHVRKKFTL